MNIIIAGAGQVGFNLAKALCIGHDVTVIDQNEEALYRIQESLDILPLQGDVENSQTYEIFKNRDIDLFIAVTNVDNVNLIATMIAGSVLNIDKTIVRLQKYFKDIFIIKEKLGIDVIVFPLRVATKSVLSLLSYPKGNNVKLFKYTKYKLISIRISANAHPTQIHSQNIIQVGIERGQKFFIPKEDEQLLANDLVYFFGLEEKIEEACSIVESDISINNIQKCVVYGGEKLGVSIAKGFIEAGKDVKLIEKDLALCKIADNELEGRATVINAKYNAHNVFEEENLGEADMFIATSNNDEFNIIKCLVAKEKGIKKIVAINNDMEYYNLMHSLGIVVVRGPKISAYNKIIEEISSNGVIVQKGFCGLQATVFMRKIFPNSHLVQKTLKPLYAKDTKIVYIRDETLYPFIEKTSFLENDIIIAFGMAKVNEKLKQWIYEL